MTCDICDGSGYIRIPIRLKLSVIPDHCSVIPFDSSPSYREYTCPECKAGDNVSETHVRVIRTSRTYDYRFSGQDEYRDYMKENAVRAIAYELLRSGCINFTFNDDGRFTGKMTADVGVVSAEFVADLEQRSMQKLPSALREIESVAAKKISNWGSYYTGAEGPISKEMAMRFVREAFSEAIEGKK